jgi:anaerobic ribonucleoside-triphosphate reductase activating protein
VNYGTIKHLDIANGPGCRVSIFVSGCRNHCKGCFQPETWDFTYGKEFDSEALQELLRLLADPHVSGLSILGGDPFEPENRNRVLDICRTVRERFGDTRTIWVWTGYEWEDLRDLSVMRYIDVLVDGPFKEELRDLRLFYRGSSNQRVIDIPESTRRGCAIRWKGDQKWK